MLGGAPPHDPAKYDGDQNLPCIAAGLIWPTKSCRSRREETPLRELTRWQSAISMVLPGQVGMVLLWVEVGQRRLEVCTYLGHDLFAHRASIAVSNTSRRRYLVTNTKWTWRLWMTLQPCPYIEVCLRPGCRRPTLRCVP